VPFEAMKLIIIVIQSKQPEYRASCQRARLCVGNFEIEEVTRM